MLLITRLCKIITDYVLQTNAFLNVCVGLYFRKLLWRSKNITDLLAMVETSKHTVHERHIRFQCSSDTNFSLQKSDAISEIPGCVQWAIFEATPIIVYHCYVIVVLLNTNPFHRQQLILLICR